ncbi:MAG: twin-arginine translocase subunit TatC [Xanthomonadales bacterium]|nr:twin-arginine translocase subunit TatC [Xanthomonadales bacterium]
MTTPDPEASQDAELSFIEHLAELRNRLLRAVAAVLLVFVVLVPFARQIYAALAQPLLGRLPEGSQLVAIEVAGPFLTPIKMAFFVALLATMPYILYQAWAFVAPALYRHEKRLAVPLLVSSTLLFYLGCAFAFFLVMPVVFTFIASMTPDGVAMMTDIGRYLDFVLMLFLAFGLSFEVPVATIIIVATGWMDVERLRRGRPYVIVGAFVIGAIVTPPDVLSQVMLAVPMWLLFELGLVAAARLVARRPADQPGA